MLGHRNFIKCRIHCSGLESFQNTFSRIDHNDVWLRQGAQCSLFIVLLYFGITLHALLYTNPVTLYYSENMCTNEGATSTSDTQAVNASTCASIS